MLRLYMILIACLGFANQSLGEGDPIVGFAKDDPAMNQAIADAQASLPAFLIHAVDDTGYGLPGASLKVSFPVTFNSEKQNEIIWIGPFLQLSKSDFTGILSNQPHFMDGLNKGDQVDFEISSIQDWAFWQQNGTAYGNFTTRVIAKGMGDNGVDLLNRMIIPAIPADWQ